MFTITQSRAVDKGYLSTRKMLENATDPAEFISSASQRFYPDDLAVFVHDRWSRVSVDGISLIPNLATLGEFFSTCYHASLLRDEERPVTFRATLAPPSIFATNGRPPEGLQRLDFSRPLSFAANEIRRLSVAADSQRTLIGVQTDESGESGLKIWGLINSGRRWLRNVQGGRLVGAPLPPVLVVNVAAPGMIEVYKGYELIGQLHGGKLSGSRVNLFESQWLRGEFSQFRERLMERHEAAREDALNMSGELWASLEPSLPRKISERMMKRVISMLRDARHGGTIIFVPVDRTTTYPLAGSPIDLKYEFARGSPQLAFPDLVVDILNRLAQVHAAEAGLREPIDWPHFESTTDDTLVRLDEALFETANLIAGLAAVDGAVILSKQHELLGFGGMISGRLPSTQHVARAVDLEGQHVTEEDLGNVGARHRSAYRLVGAFPGAVAIVISQDGGVRIVCQKEGRVTYWEHE